jgi:hypothetical protein
VQKWPQPQPSPRAEACRKYAALKYEANTATILNLMAVLAERERAVKAGLITK